MEHKKPTKKQLEILKMPEWTQAEIDMQPESMQKFILAGLNEKHLLEAQFAWMAVCCPDCGQAFIPFRKWQRYCGGKCSQHGAYLRRQARIAEWKRIATASS